MKKAVDGGTLIILLPPPEYEFRADDTVISDRIEMNLQIDRPVSGFVIHNIGVDATNGKAP